MTGVVEAAVVAGTAQAGVEAIQPRVVVDPPTKAASVVEAEIEAEIAVVSVVAVEIEAAAAEVGAICNKWLSGPVHLEEVEAASICKS